MAVERIIRYLANIPRYGLIFTRISSQALHAFSNVGQVGDCNDRHSIGGYYVFLDRDLISQCLRKQRTVARFSIETKCKCLVDMSAIIMWIEYLLRNLHALPLHTHTLQCNNLFAIYLTAGLVFHARTKHAEINYHFIRERLTCEQLYVPFMSSND